MAVPDPEAGCDQRASSSSPAPRLTPQRIDALIRLLADEDPAIHGVVSKHLGEALDVTRPYLVQRSRADRDPRVRAAAESFLRQLALEERLGDFEHFARSRPRRDDLRECRDGLNDELDLETGAFLIAATESPDLDIPRYRRRLDKWSRVLSARLPAKPAPATVAAKLVHLLYCDLGLRGNREAYYDPANSFLDRVLDRRRGIPISLAVVAILVARRIGFELEGVGLPGHFLVRYRDGRRTVYLDPFDVGRVWTLEDCMAHLHNQGYGLREGHLDPFSSRKTLIRMLGNLLGIFRQREDEAREARVTLMLEALQ